ncbi:MAG: reverse transcriptase, partial [Candidatus Omnitrophica bacterium]|nr:reverse transcriptase [Candidatus Omnitrophota bacterium]
SSRPYALALKHYDWVKKEIETLEKSGVIEESLSPWASPIVVVPKKSAPGEPPRRRLCIDFRKINALQPEVLDGKSKGRATLIPLPKIDDLFARLKGAQIFSTLDLRSGYYHISLSKESQPKTAFVTPFGKWQFKQVPFGLAQAPAYFQQLMNKVVKKFDFAEAYLDDIIIFSNTPEEHLKHLEDIFQELETAGLKLKREKCDFFKQEIHYLGHIISVNGVKPLPDKLKAIQEMPAPTNPKEIRQFLGLAGYYRKFVPRFADLSRPLTKLTRKDEKFVWTKECQASFQILKESLCKDPILKYPDTNKSYMLFTDASKYAWAGVLTQGYPDEQGKTTQHPVAYVSGLFNKTQVKWAALTKEAFAIYKSVKKLIIYTSGCEVLIKSDHKPLKRFLEKATQNENVDRWALQLEGQKLKIDYIEGVKNTLADTLSRLIKLNPDIKKEPEPQGYEFGIKLADIPKVTVEALDCTLDSY